MQQYTSTRLNLAHALRRSGRFDEALVQFDEVIRLGLREAGVFASKGLVLLELEQPFDATVALHEALAISPQDPMASDLLSKALAQLEGDGILGGAEEEVVDAGLREKLAAVRKAKASRKRRVIQQVDEDEDGGEGMDLDGASDSRRRT
jgi:anaphase-promoting complex subunit 6